MMYPRLCDARHQMVSVAFKVKEAPCAKKGVGSTKSVFMCKNVNAYRHDLRPFQGLRLLCKITVP